MEEPSLTMTQYVVPDAALADEPASLRAAPDPTLGAAGRPGTVVDHAGGS